MTLPAIPTPFSLSAIIMGEMARNLKVKSVVTWQLNIRSVD